MAEFRIPSSTIATLHAPSPAPRVDAARAASRAFFQTVVSNDPAPSRPAAPAPAATPTAAPDPERPLRPGSLVDVRI